MSAFLQTEDPAPSTLHLLFGGTQHFLKHSIVWQEAIKLFFFSQNSIRARFHCLPTTCQLYSIFSTYRVLRQNRRKTGSHQGARGENAAGLSWAGSCLHASSPSPSWVVTFLPCFSTRPLSWSPSICMGFAPSYLCPLISVCFSGLWPLCWPKLQLLSCSFVLVTALSWPSQLAVNSTGTEWEGMRGEFHLVNWVVKRKKGCFYYFFFFLSK